MDVPGRTGHDYDNQWIGEDLLWKGKTGSHLRQPSIQAMIGPMGRVYLFTRSHSRDPFVFVGCGRPRTWMDTAPVTVLWRLLDPAEEEGDEKLLAPMDGLVRETPDDYLARALVGRWERRLEVSGTFDPASVVEGRDRAIGAIVRRRGQGVFRQTLLLAYEGRCAITGTDGVEALEAAHIVPFRGDATNHPANGLLLRADIHVLFDLGHLAIESQYYRLVTGPGLRDTEYAGYGGMGLRLPSSSELRPSREALDWHRAWAGL